MPHLLFYGPPGTGKTSTVLACARKLNGPNFQSMILELNASDDRGIDVVRNQIKSFASSKKLFSKGTKLIILDEADAMTKTAQFALRRVIEKYTSNTRFCLICNYIGKIIPALQSRCTRFRFAPLQALQITTRMNHVIATEQVKMSTDGKGLAAIIKLSGGDMRKCLNVLQACHLAYDEVTEEAAYLCTGNPLPSDVLSILQSLLNLPYAAAYNALRSIQVQKGLSCIDIVTALHELIGRVKLTPDVLGFVLAKLSDVEFNLAFDTSEKLQLGALVGIFQIAKHRSLASVAAAE
jgi:replication factor C subunit 3/5